MRKTHKVSTAVLLSSFSVTFALSFSSVFAQSQLPLGEQIRQNQSAVNEDRQALRRDQRREQQAEQGTQQYVQATEQWIQQNDAQMQANQAQLNQLESKIKSKATLQKLLNTPGSQLYVLQTLINKEAAMKAQAEGNIQNAGLSLSNLRSAVQQDRYQITSDSAVVQHNQGLYGAEMDSHQDMVRLMNDSLYARDGAFMRTRRNGRFYTGLDQASYDSGRHAPGLGNPYWGSRGNRNGFQGQ